MLCNGKLYSPLLDECAREMELENALKKALQVIGEKDKRIQELEEELQRVKYLSKFGK